MAGDDTGDKTLTVRCNEEFQRLLKAASGVRNLDTSEYVRRTMREQATEDLGPETVDEIERRVSEGDPEISVVES